VSPSACAHSPRAAEPQRTVPRTCEPARQHAYNRESSNSGGRHNDGAASPVPPRPDLAPPLPRPGIRCVGHGVRPKNTAGFCKMYTLGPRRFFLTQNSKLGPAHPHPVVGRARAHGRAACHPIARTRVRSARRGCH